MPVRKIIFAGSTILLLAATGAWADFAQVDVKEGQVNLREQPCGDSPVVAKFDDGTKVILETWSVPPACGNTEWSKVVIGSFKGYIAKSLLRRPSQSVRARVNAPKGKARLQTEPCGATDPIVMLADKAQMLVLERGIASECGGSGPWAKVTIYGEIGYMLERDFLVEEGSGSKSSMPAGDGEAAAGT